MNELSDFEQGSSVVKLWKNISDDIKWHLRLFLKG